MTTVTILLILVLGTLLLPAGFAALTANREVNRYVDQELRTYKVKASTHIYKGAFVGLEAATGYARGLVAGDVFLGVAYEECDNSSGSDGDWSLRVFTFGDFAHTLTGVAITNIGAAVYASDDNTLTLTASGNSLVGRVQDYAAANAIILRIYPGANTTNIGNTETVVNKTQADTPVTLTTADSGKIFANAGATGEVEFDLPAAPPVGIRLTFAAAAAQVIKIDPGASDAIIIDGAIQTDGYWISFDDEGEHVTLVSNADGNWLVVSELGTITVQT